MQTIAFEISRAALPNWGLLPHSVRWHLRAFPASMSAQANDASPPPPLIQPMMSAASTDVGETARRLATAFPRLLRRVTEVVMGEPIRVRLECQGLHEGMWGALIEPTWRRISFEELHEIAALGGRVVSDRVTLDVQGILSQLCSHDRIDPDETARLGRARRGACARAKIDAE